MASSGLELFAHDFEESISPRKMTNKAESSKQRAENSKYKEETLYLIISIICALFNSGGGRLTLKLEGKISREDLDSCYKMIEQRIRNLTSVTTVSEIVVTKTLSEIVMFISPSSRLVTLDYHLYLPDECEVVLLPPYEPFENIRNILQRNIGQNKRTLMGTHCKDFVKGQDVGFGESKSCQHKMIKTTRTKRTTIANRMCGKSNKISSYISAYGNLAGGHIYYGIAKDGTVEGELISEGDKMEINKEVAKSVKKMKWPGLGDRGPKLGAQWEVYFEPVKDSSGHVIESLYVIVVFIAHCPGGVFTEEPESYHVVNGKRAKMSFREWMSYFQDSSSSVGARLLNMRLMYNLMECRNDENACEKQFMELISRATAQYPESPVFFASLIQLSERITATYKKHDFAEAKRLIDDFESSIPLEESNVFEVMAFYHRSCIECAQKNYERSYILCQRGLEIMKSVKPHLITVQFYLHAAMLTIIMLCRNGRGFSSFSAKSFRSQAQDYLKQAKKDLNDLQNYLRAENVLEDVRKGLLDLEQKLYIYMAAVHLGCAFNGESVDAIDVSDEDISEAFKEVEAVRDLGKKQQLSNYRHIQLMLTRCDLHLRRAGVCPTDEVNSNREEAIKLAQKAKSLAELHHFKQMIVYAERRLEVSSESNFILMMLYSQ